MSVSASTDERLRRATRIAYVSSAVAVASLVVSALATTRAVREPSAPTATAASAQDTGAVAAELRALKARLDALQAPPPANAAPDAKTSVGSLLARLQALETMVAANANAAAHAAKAGAGSSSAPPAPPAPKYVSFDVPNPKLRVKQAADGSLSAENSDPALVGQTVVVKALQSDGTQVPITITVPKTSS